MGGPFDPDSGSAAVPMPGTDAQARPWHDISKTPGERADTLLEVMTVEEKIAQLGSLWLVTGAEGQVAPHHEGSSPAANAWEERLGLGLGQLTRPYGSAPVNPDEGARRLADLQRRITSSNRFALPALAHEECLTGINTWGATVYPAPLCWGASFDPELVERVGAQIGKDMRRLGVHQGLAPLMDVTRDLRWGRTEETIGEDPYLVGTIGSAYVRGLESAGVVATLKHFVGYSSSRAGRNFGPVSLGMRELADTLLPPFEMALRAGARSVMNAYTDLDGVPVAASRTILSELLRGDYGFEGTVVSDYFSVAFLQALHRVAADPANAAALALQAGIDVELPSVDAFGNLAELVTSGALDVHLVDRAVRRVLVQKCELGLLDPDWPAEPPILSESADDAVAGALDTVENRHLAGELARSSVVLLANNGVLPLAPGQNIAVVGPLAAEAFGMLGCYSFPMHVGVHHPDLPLGIAVPTVLEALQGDVAGYNLVYERGCPLTGGDDEPLATACNAAAAADVCIVVLGDKAGLFGAGTSGEGCDAVDLRLPGRQEELLGAILATGVPTVLLLLAGRPYDISRQAPDLAAVLCAFFPGEEGANAIADVLAGRINPSGRLPVSFPAAGGPQPSTYLGPVLAQRTRVSKIDTTPLFPFGHGLSYAPARWVSVERASSSQWQTDGTAHVRVTLANPHDRATMEVVQLYLHDPLAEVVRPVRQLIAAKRAHLGPGQECVVEFELHADLTSFTGLQGSRIVDEGQVVIEVGRSSGDIVSAVEFLMTGGRREVGFDRVMQPNVRLIAS